MRILHVLNHTWWQNGHVHAAVDLACAQARLGHQVAMASAGGDFDDVMHANGVETFFIDQERKPIAALKAALALSGLIRSWKVDVVHAHMMTSAILSWPGCKLARIPLITTVHNEFEKSAILMGIGDRVIAVSKKVGASMIKRGISASRLRVVLNGTIGAARFDLLDRTPQALRSPSIVFVGGLHPRKGVADLLQAFSTVHAAHPNAQLTLVGGGPHMQEYQETAASMGDAVQFTGPQANPRSYLLGADIFVLPSHADPAPLVIPEAREAGCAIIASNVDGIPELLDDGEAGILVPPRDPERLAAAILELIENPETLALWRQKSAANIENLTIGRVARDTINVYNEVR